MLNKVKFFNSEARNVLNDEVSVNGSYMNILCIRFILLLVGFTFHFQTLSQSIIINEVTQGPNGSKEYVEFLVVGPNLINCNDVPPCLDLRLWIFDDNNGYLNGGSSTGVGIASGAVRFADDPFWSCIPVGTLIVIYNDGDFNPDLPPDDTDMTDGNCALTLPISSSLFDRHTTLPSPTNTNYSATGWVNGGSWTPISMANGQDGFQIYSPTNLTTPVFSIGWGAANTFGDIWMGASTATGDVFYATDCDYYNQASWVEGPATSMQTPGALNNATQEDCVGLMNANCNPPTVTISSTPAFCGNCDGTATATITGGTAPFQLTWTPAPPVGQGTTTISGLCSGIYDLLLVDDNGTGCSLVTTVTIGSSGDAIFPTASNPVPIVVQCAADVPLPNPAVVTDAADNGGPPVVTWEDDTSDGNSCPEIITRRYRITDDCGNFIFVVQTITIDDNIAPTGTAPANVTVQCAADVPAVNVGSVTGVSDNCGVPTVTHLSDVSNGNTCPEIITRTYRITDICGNFINVTQTITINDNIPPTGTAPANVIVQCIGDVPAVNVGSVTGLSDNCGVPTVTHLSDVSNGNTCPEIITRTYRITDACGNFTDVVQTITIDDNIAPTGTAPANVTVQCIGDVPAVNVGSVTGVSDNCGVPTVTHVSDVSNGNTCPEIITRTYRITDACGNFTDVVQTITIDDNIAPTGTAPANVTVQCVANVPAVNIGSVTGLSDNCGVPTVTHLSDVSNGNTCPEIITRTYRITDACGNFTDVVQTITIDDNIAPTGTAPANVTVQCAANVPAVNIGSVTGLSDNCGVPTVTHLSDVSNGNICPEIITRTYRITDACGNFTDVVQTITIDDDIAPTATNPVAINVACITDVPPANPAVVADAADNCGAPIVAHVGDVSDGNVCDGEVITRTYSVTDACGNSITVTQTITINALTPTFTLSSTDPTSCGATDGTITISGLIPGEDYDVSFNGGGVVTFTADGAGNIVLTGLAAGSYTGFEVSDANCPMCSALDNASISLTAPNSPGLDAGIDQTVCDGDQVTLTANNPDGATITWDNGVTDGTAFTPAVGTTTYTVTANLAGCISTDQVNVTVNPLPIVDAGVDVFICEGESVALTASGATTYIWDNGVTNGVTFSPSQTGTYTVVGTLGNCFASDFVTVTVNPVSDVSFNADNLSGCIPVEVTLANTSDFQGEECVWTLGNGVTLYGCDNVSAYFTTAGCFDVTLTIISTDGCSASATYGNYICVEDAPIANFSPNPQVVTTTNPTINFMNGSIGAVDYDWDFGDGATSNALNPNHTFDNTQEGVYTVQLIAYSAFGCSDTAFAQIEVQEDLIFYVPNTFTPDGDAYNETFLPIFTSGFDIYDYNLLIFNRWGEVLFESNNSEIGWDGTYGGVIVKDGTYIWKIEFKTNYTDERQVHHGHVNVLR